MVDEVDKDLKEAIEACTKVIEEKCGKRPYMITISKANVGFASEEDKKKGLLRGNTSYMYIAKPPIRNHTISKILIDASKKALEQAEEKTRDTKSDKKE